MACTFDFLVICRRRSDIFKLPSQVPQRLIITVKVFCKLATYMIQTKQVLWMVNFPTRTLNSRNKRTPLPNYKNFTRISLTNFEYLINLFEPTYIALAFQWHGVTLQGSVTTYLFVRGLISVNFCLMMNATF